jgi:lipopolysaccharide transport system permease protein
MVRDLAASRELAWRLFVRNTSARYRQTALGWLWAFVPPVAGTLLFVFLRRSGVFRVDDPGVPYVLFLVCGLVLWQTFADAVQAPLRLVAQSKSMLTKINFPREALVLAGVAEVLFNFLVRALLLAGALVWFAHVPSAAAALAPLGLLALVALGTAIGLVLVPFGLLFQDVEQGLALLLSFWMFATPVLYPPPTGRVARAMTLNPVASVLDTTRAWLLGVDATWAPLAGSVAAATLAILLAAWVVYRLALPILIERIGS